MNSELTYQEHVNAKKRELINEYNDRVKTISRNISFQISDFCDQGFLSNSFFENSNLSPIKKSILRDITKQFKQKFEKINL